MALHTQAKRKQLQDCESQTTSQLPVVLSLRTTPTSTVQSGLCLIQSAARCYRCAMGKLQSSSPGEGKEAR